MIEAFSPALRLGGTEGWSAKVVGLVQRIPRCPFDAILFSSLSTRKANPLASQPHPERPSMTFHEAYVA